VHTHRFFEHITKYGKSSIMITYILLLQQKLLIFLKTKVLHCSIFLYSSIIFFFRFKTISKLHLFLASLNRTSRISSEKNVRVLNAIIKRVITGICVNDFSEASG